MSDYPLPADRYRTIIAGQMEEQTRLLRRIADSCEALDSRLDQLEARANQTLAICAATEARYCEPPRLIGTIKLPNLLFGGGESLTAEVIKTKTGQEMTEKELAEMGRRHDG